MRKKPPLQRDFRKEIKRIGPGCSFSSIVIGPYILSIQGGTGYFSNPQAAKWSAYDYRAFEVNVWEIGNCEGVQTVPQTDKFDHLWDTPDASAGYVPTKTVQEIYEYLKDLVEEQ